MIDGKRSIYMTCFDNAGNRTDTETDREPSPRALARRADSTAAPSLCHPC